VWRPEVGQTWTEETEPREQGYRTGKKKLIRSLRAIE